ncbi:hypothetical protein JCM14467A_06110 [Vulcanisaeta sp. JCM 14467]
MVSRSRLLLIIAAVIAAVVVTSMLLTMPRLSTNHSAVAEAKGTVAGKFAAANQGVVGSPISISVPIYVVGPSTLVQKLVSVGVNESLIKPVTVSELPSLPGNSLVVIDWSVIGPNLIINRSGLMRVNVNSTSFRLIRELIRRGDFLIIHRNASEAPAIELALATAWARAFNTSIIATPVPRYLNGLDYVVAYGNSHVLLIGPHSLRAALRIASRFWIPLIMKISTPDPTGEDVCWELMQTYGISSNEAAQVNNAYIIALGPQPYQDSYGAFDVDFCISWSEVIIPNLNGYSAGSAYLYNWINYRPNTTIYTTISYLKTFQDAYASYVVYQYETGQASQVPRDVSIIPSGGGYEPGYWVNLQNEPPAQTCTPSTSYTITFPIAFEDDGTPSAGVTATYNCPEYTITVNNVPQESPPLGTASNWTWVFTPQTTQYAEQAQAYGVMGNGPTYMGPAYNPQPTVYVIPAGSSALVYTTAIMYIGGVLPVPIYCYDHVVYDINWDVWINVNNGAASMNGQTNGFSIVPPGAYGSNWGLTNNGFAYTSWCQ